MTQTTYLNIAGYRFFTIENPESLVDPLLDFCKQLDLLGTILLSEEGFNCYMVGLADAMERFQHHLQQDLGFPEIEYKTSWSTTLPFRRMKVKVKKEIITMGFPDIEPAKSTAPHLPPQEFKQWLDEKRDITVLDTRNDYETKAGKFSNALELGVKTFTEFAAEAQQLSDEIKDKPLVMYCTGGIRCEKASALFLEKYGFKEVYQLDGGILKYFQQCGDAHYQGNCFVFDERTSIDKDGLPSA